MSTVPPGPRRAPITSLGIVQRAGDFPAPAPFEQPQGERWYVSLALWIGVLISPPMFTLLIIAIGRPHP